jgi:hypothetical protein
MSRFNYSTQSLLSGKPLFLELQAVMMVANTTHILDSQGSKHKPLSPTPKVMDSSVSSLVPVLTK